MDMSTYAGYLIRSNPMSAEWDGDMNPVKPHHVFIPSQPGPTRNDQRAMAGGTKVGGGGSDKNQICRPSAQVKAVPNEQIRGSFCR